MDGKTLAEHFREHAELIDRPFTLVDLRYSRSDSEFRDLRRDVTGVHVKLDVILKKLSAPV